MRYNQLIQIIAHHKPKTIVETGTWDGHRAILMATEALKHNEKVHYIGFDLFEDATEETDKKELNVKAHHSLVDVEGRLEGFQKENPGFKFTLIKGDTRETLTPRGRGYEVLSRMGNLVDLAFIDGGHSVETIRSDYENLKHSKVIVFDDFYTDRDSTEHGCNSVVEDLSRVVLPQADPVKGGGKVQMVLVPKSAFPGPANLVIKTKNCVPDERIRANIRYHMELNAERYLLECAVHDDTAVLVSGGPSFMERLKEIKRHSKLKRSRVICVKHSHDRLIENGVVPWACMLLDPRNHVQDFIENPHPDVLYFVASMCHPTTLDQLLNNNAKIVGYHAHVGAGEEGVIGNGHIMVGGGSTSAVRAVSVLHTLGFRTFKMYGYDSCYLDPSELDLSEKDKRGKKKFFEVEVSGRKFISDAELTAQAQDFDKLMSQKHPIDLEVIGDGMIPHIWQMKRRVLPDYREALNG